MREPRRLLEEGLDDFERGLLASSVRDVPSDHAYQRTLASIGVGLLMPLGAAGVAHATTAAAVAAGSSKVGMLVLGKWLGTGLLLGAVTATGATFSQRVLSRAEEASVPAKRPEGHERRPPQGPPQSAPDSAPIGVAAEVAPVPSAAKRRVEVSLPKESPPVPASSGGTAENERSLAEQPATVKADSLQREMTLIDSARQALRRGDATQALDMLTVHAREFERGALAPEARLLEISALLQTGQRERALAIARRVIAGDPDGQHAAAVRTLLAAHQKP